MHNPKCGGTSLSNAIGRLFGGFSQPQQFRLDSAAALKGTRICLAPYAYEEADPTRCMNEAIRNLNKFSLVGDIEKLNQFNEQFSGRYHLDLRIQTLNRNPVSRSVPKNMITDEIREMVEGICRYDLEVYNRALQKLALGHD